MGSTAIRSFERAVVFACVVACLGCGEGGGGETAGGGRLEIRPDNITLDVVNGVPVEQAYQAFLHAADGQVIDVTATTTFLIDQTDVGIFDGPVLTVSGERAGESTIRAVSGNAEASAGIIVNVAQTRVIGPAPADAPGLFSRASESPSLVPAVVYPFDEVLVPPNLGDLDVHWQAPAQANLFEVTIASEHLTVRIYTSGAPSDWLSVTLAEWTLIGSSLRSNSFTITVRAMNVADETVAGTSLPIKVSVASEDVEGGLYYWALASSDGAPEGIYRHDMQRPGQAPEEFFTRRQTQGRCVGCHALSRDGTKMAVTLYDIDGSDDSEGVGSILDVRTGQLDLADDGSFRWNFATFAPQNDRLVTTYQGTMALRSATTGAVISQVSGTDFKAHPDYAPDGSRIAYVSTPTAWQDWYLFSGDIVTRTVAPDGTFGDPVTLVDTADNVYYPSWSPDSKWILFSRSTNVSYDDASARLWVVPADGSLPPVMLSAADINTGLTNSWPRWTPFSQTYKPQNGAPEPVMWLTFSSKRAFGVRLPAGRPQIWMAPFFPERARAGQDPTGPAFRLPFQSILSHNHIAQWTERVIQVE